MTETPILESFDTGVWLRLSPRIDRSGGPDACWPCSYSANSGGYLQIWAAGRRVYVHRLMLTLALGRDLKPGMQAGHICHDRAAEQGECEGGVDCPHRRCCNPAHLQEQSTRENLLASANTVTAIHAAAACCAAGHPLGGDNRTANALRRGWRSCRECNREQASILAAKVRAARTITGLKHKAFCAAYGQSRAVADAIIRSAGLDPDLIESEARARYRATHPEVAA